MRFFSLITATWASELIDWDTELNDFRANIFENITIAASSQHVTTANLTGSKIRGAFFVSPSRNSKSTVDFEIVDPAGTVVFSARNEKEDIFSVNVDMTGVYSIVISNNKWLSASEVQLVVDTGDHTIPTEHFIDTGDVPVPTEHFMEPSQ